ncbi:heparinase II/III-family protein [Sabulilitoribacter arenilitoris]|uniref:Heparinase II/III-family protein n=1 Tax=Wocania arenilitoris TaxID=2044858 RepID=A0AAE3EMP7_9FLAO|nr:heparinase II/III family protein [Wocania arenilitoris]MCF7567723.1 heparinase II/III-family protein [Wocania arenilitoris]
MKSKLNLILLLCLAIFLVATAQEQEIQPLENPMSVQYLKKNLKKSQPRLVLNSKIEKQLKKKLANNLVVKNIYKAIQLNAESVLEQDLLTRKIKIQGRRLLGTSREMLWRVNMLGMVYRMEKDPKILNRINDEVIAVCNFSDWNPSHFLDVAEMSMAVALALDWTGGDLPKSSIEMAKIALIEKGIKPSYQKGTAGLLNGHNNWNQVCNGGMIAASIAIAEKDPELAAKTIQRSLNGIPHALTQYGPDGVYPEGSTYWEYGTSFSVMTVAMLESSFGTDFGITDYPAFKESAVFRYLMNTPSGQYFNFADCGDKRSKLGDITLAWFGVKTGNHAFYEKDRFLMPAKDMGKLSRLSGAGLVWLAQYEKKSEQKIPTVWKGDGSNPLVVFKGDENDTHNYYFGGKGGRATTGHGNMDAGSFIFELNGVRWAIDPGNQGYYELEKTGFNLWKSCQDCQRWNLLTKNNYGHNTITINNALFVNNGQATLEYFQAGEKPKATFDLTAIYGENVTSAKRTFIKDGPVSVVIEDEIETSDKTELITWQFMTTADVEFVNGGALLEKDGKTLKIENLSHPELSFSLVSLYPAPMKLDRQIVGLKRVELRIPAWTIKGSATKIKVRLIGE